MACIPAPSLLALRAEVNAKAPNRNKASDGICPSAAHTKQNPDSLHETGSALDITHDPAGGFDANELVRSIVSRKPTGVVYEVIFNGVYYSKNNDWNGRPITKGNMHTTHVHVGVTSLGRAWPGPWFVATGGYAGDTKNFIPGLGGGGATIPLTVGANVAGKAAEATADIFNGGVGTALAMKDFVDFISDRNNWRRLGMFLGGMGLVAGGAAIILSDMSVDIASNALGGSLPEGVDVSDVVAAV